MKRKRTTSRVVIQGIKIEYSGDDPEAFRQAAAAGFEAILGPIRRAMAAANPPPSEPTPETPPQ